MLLFSGAVLVVARLFAIGALGVLDRLFRVNRDFASRFPGLESRANRYYPLLRALVSLAIAWVGAVALLEVWGVDAIAWYRGNAFGGRLASALTTIAIAAAVGAAVWEAVNAAMDYRLDRLDHDLRIGRAARIRTLLPMLRTALLISILVVFALTVLSEIGVNTAPLLAGAGIVGIAIGFGSQKLVQDLITGLFLLLENAIQVGDFVTVAGLSGSVENLSIRTLRLRAGDGSVHIVPFSSVTTVTNANRGIGNAAVSVTVPFEEDPDRVGQTLKQIVSDMRKEAPFKSEMLSDLQLWGVDKVDGASTTIVGQIVCTDGGRWDVQREFNRRLKQTFQSQGIHMAQPSAPIVINQQFTPAPAAEPPLESPAAHRANAVNGATDSRPS